MNLYQEFIRRCVLPSSALATRSKFWSLYKTCHRRRQARHYPSPEEVIQKLQALVTHAYDSVPFYQKRMNSLDLKPNFLRTLDDLRILPPTTKSDLAANFPDGLTSSRRDFTPWRFVATSGTVDRATVIHDFRKRDFVRAAQLLALQTATGYMPGMKYMEIPPDICANVCGAGVTLEPNLFGYVLRTLKDWTIFDPEVISNVRGLVERQLVYRRVDFPALAPDGLVQKRDVLDRYLERIREYGPHVVKALPAYLYLLALYLTEEAMNPPRIAGGLMPMGSSMTPYMKGVVQAAFDCPVHEDYGCAELGTVASECGRQNGLHPFADLFYLEVVRDGRPVKEDAVGKILITDLWNYAMPLIRYEVGDVGVVRRDPCGCGLRGDRLEVHGRLQDCLAADDGSILTPDTITDSILTEPDVLAFQLEAHQNGELHLRIVPKNGRHVKLDQIVGALSLLLGPSRRIAARSVTTILPERGGKYRFVKNLTKDAGELL